MNLLIVYLNDYNLLEREWNDKTRCLKEVKRWTQKNIRILSNEEMVLVIAIFFS